MKTAVIIPAAGTGSRMGTEKQLLQLSGKPVLARTIEAFEAHDEIDDIIVVSKHKLTGYKKVRATIPGGETRQASVREGLKALADDVAWVLIHDGARPLVTQQAISAVLGYVRRGYSAVSGVKAKDTVKITDENNIITATPNREATWLVQTPQGFPREIITEAHKQDFIGTDDAMLVERMGVAVRMVEGDYRNIKLTTPEDILLAESFLHKEGSH